MSKIFCKGVAKVTNNLFNIKYNPQNNWVGQDGQYKGFCKFVSQGYGIRAGVKLLYNYIFKMNILHVDNIIQRFAPRDDNQKVFDVYVLTIEKAVGLHDIRTREGFLCLCKSIAHQECQAVIPDSQLYFIFDCLELKFLDSVC